MNTTKTIDVRKLIDDQPVGRYQKWVIFLCFLIIALDGFDIAIMGFIAPQLKLDWGVTPHDLAPVLSAALIGLGCGALIAGPLADRCGRKGVLVCSVFLFGLLTLLTAFAPDIETLAWMRLVTGFGLGAAMPNACTLVSEYAPQRSRSFWVGVVFSGYPCGAALGGFISSWVIPNLGWHNMLVLGGLMPLVLVPLLLAKLPESVSLLVIKQAPVDKIRRIVNRLSPKAGDGVQRFVVPTMRQQNGNALSSIVSKSYRFGTLMLWCAYFLALFLHYLFSSWLPTLVKDGGYSVSDAAIVTSVFHASGPIGALFMGWAMDRWGRFRVVVTGFILSAMVIFSIGHSLHYLGLLCLSVWVAGMCMAGANVGLNALATSYYPTEVRATGAGWMSGVGRLGAIFSVFAGAQMIALGWSFSQVFAALVVPACLAALAVFLLGNFHSRSSSAPVAGASNL